MNLKKTPLLPTIILFLSIYCFKSILGSNKIEKNKFLLIIRSNGAEKFAEELMKYIDCDIEDMGHKYDAYIVIGGDGTLLRALLNRPNPPVIYAINGGKVGFLCPIDTLEIKELARRLKSNVKIDSIKRIRLSLNGKLNFLNEVVIKPFGNELGSFKITIDGVIYNIKGDAVIVATDSGSTGYNSSVGGPLLLTNCIVVNVISPCRCNFKPLVCGMNSNIKVELLNGSPMILADGVLIQEKELNVSYKGSIVEFGYLSRYRIDNAINNLIYLY